MATARIQEKSRNQLPRVHPLVSDKKLFSKLVPRRTAEVISVNCSSFGWGIFSSWGRKETTVVREKVRLKRGESEQLSLKGREDVVVADGVSADKSLLKRCSWITKFSDEVYVSFHDECWGVPVFHDSQLFELLTLSGLLIDHNWTEILRRRELYREVFAKFDHNVVAKMDEKDVKKIMRSNKNLSLAECRIRCIVDNAKCIQKVAGEYGSFSGYLWSHVNHRPIINKQQHCNQNSRRRSSNGIVDIVPLKTPRSTAISKDLVSRGFRLVSPVTVYSFMQAAGMAIDHETGCFRFNECVKLAEKSWGLTNLGM